MIKMASDHLRVTIEFLSGGPLLQRGLLLYSPSTVKTLKEELSHAHGVPAKEITVYFDGLWMGDAVRIVDQRLYHVRLPPKWTDPLGERSEMGFGRGMTTVEPCVTLGEGVHIDSIVEVDTTPKVLDARVYVVFGFSGVVRLFDVTHGAILSPMPMMRLGYCVLYVDWALLRPLTKDVPTDPTTWLYDRVQRDYGILPTSSAFGIHTAPLAELRRYHEAMEGWMIRQPLHHGGGMEGEPMDEVMEGDEEEDDGEDEEEEDGEDEEGMEPWQGTELDDSEWWR
jgi:hypothetical protein